MLTCHRCTRLLDHQVMKYFSQDQIPKQRCRFWTRRPYAPGVPRTLHGSGVRGVHAYNAVCMDESMYTRFEHSTVRQLERRMRRQRQRARHACAYARWQMRADFRSRVALRQYSCGAG